MQTQYIKAKSFSNEDTERIRESLRKYKNLLNGLIWYAETLERQLDKANFSSLGTINFAAMKLNEDATFENLTDLRTSMGKQLAELYPFSSLEDA